MERVEICRHLQHSIERRVAKIPAPKSHRKASTMRGYTRDWDDSPDMEAREERDFRFGEPGVQGNGREWHMVEWPLALTNMQETTKKDHNDIS